jgi:hypothetical protein
LEAIMNATLLALFLVSQAPAEPAKPAEEAPAAQPAAEPAKEAPAQDAAVPRASAQPMGETNREALIGRIVSGVVLGVGGVLVAIGVVGLGGAAFIQLAPVLTKEYPVNENPRRTMGTIASAIAAGGLMLGLTCVLGGLFGVFVG